MIGKWSQVTTDILLICPWRVFPPSGGGSLRVYYLLRELSREFRVHAVIFQDQLNESDFFSSEKASHADNIRLYSLFENPSKKGIISKISPRLAAAIRYRWLRRNIRGPANSTLLKAYPLIKAILAENNIGFVIFEGLAAMSAAPVVKRLSPKSIRVLNAHNVDHKLIEQQLESATEQELIRALQKSKANAEWLETHLDRRIDTFWACSEADKRYLSNANDIAGIVVPNGVDTESLTFDEVSDHRFTNELLFVGSLTYQPNIDGILWFYSTAWQSLRQKYPELKLVVVGKGGSAANFPELANDESVDLVGEVPEVVPFYRRGGIAIVPLRMGSGTRLKILEALSLGNPVVSTAIGAEGIEVEAGEHLLIADEPSEFVEKIGSLIEDAILRKSLRTKGRKLVAKKYDWKISGDKARTHLREFFESRQLGA